MALTIKNDEVERLAEDVARLTGESKTEAIRKALEERRRRLKGPSIDERRRRVLRFLEEEVWSKIPKAQRRKRISKREREELLGYGRDGV
jgi:antitoxin VapB